MLVELLEHCAYAQFRISHMLSIILLQGTNLENIVPKIELLGLIMIDYDLIYFPRIVSCIVFN